MSLAAALAAASHHSAQQYVAPRGQKPATQSREGEVHEKRDCLRAQKRPLPGTPPEPLEEVAEMQGAAVTVGYVAAPVPLLVVPSMAGGDGVDGTTTKWLLKVAEGGGAGGEEEEREEGGEELLKRLQGIVHRAASLPDLTSSSSSVPGRGGRGRRGRSPNFPNPLPQVAHVSVLFSDKFQHSKVYVLKVPQVQFIDDLCTFLLCNRDRCVV